MKPEAFNPQTFLSTNGYARTAREYRSNERIFSQGGPSDTLFYIQRGKVKLTVVSKQSRESIIRILGAGDFLLSVT
jgi:CRP-like cAMP-binding protein